MTIDPALHLSPDTLEDARASFAFDVRYYLSLKPRQLPSRYFYDSLGSCLFEAICRLPWYHITGAETRLLAAHRLEIFGAAGPLARVAELGCGSGEKLATLIEARPPSGTPLELRLIDLSATALALSTRALSGFGGVRVVAHQASYEAGLAALRQPPGKAPGRTLVLFLGSNIGNFDPPGAEEFLHEIRAVLRPGDSCMIGVDLVKPEAVLRVAYDDPLGVTAAFNRNLLVRINRELGGDFDLDAFSHRVEWNAEASRIEMHLVCRRRQTVNIAGAGLVLEVEEGESIWTESSYKYEPHAIEELMTRANFSPVSQWIDREHGFALTLAKAVAHR